MAEESATQNKTVVYLLAVIAVLLLVIVGIIVWPSISGDVPEPTVTAADTTDPGATIAEPAGVAASGEEFDPTAATMVPEGQAPEEYVSEYYEAVLAEDWDTAFSMLPMSQQAGGDPTSYGEQVVSYGVVGYTISEAGETDEGYLVVADQETGAYGTFVNGWVFVDVEGAWALQDKAVTGMK